MGAFEQKVRDVITELADGDLREKLIESILESLYDVYGLWAYSKLIAARKSSDMSARSRNATEFAEARGTSIAFNEMWQKIIFDGLSVQDGTLKQKQVDDAEAYWKSRLEEWQRRAQPASARRTP